MDLYWPWYQVLVIGIVLTNPFSPYRIAIGGVNLSLDRLLIVPAGLVLLFRVCQTGRLLIPAWAAVIGFLLSISLSSISTKLELSLLSEYGPTLLQCYAVFLLVATYCATGRINRQKLVRALAIVSTVYIFYAAYSVNILYFQLQPISEPPFLSKLPSMFVPASDHLQHVGYLGRISLPFSTPQTLSVVSGALLFVLLMSRSSRMGFVYSTLALMMLIACVATISRTGVYSILLTLLFLSVMLPIARKVDRRWIVARIGLVWTAVLGGTFMVLLLFSAELIEALSRLAASWDQQATQGHVGIRLTALLAWSEASFAEQLFGIGVGNFQEVGVAFRAHMSSLTILVERGVIGLALSYWPFVIFPLAFLWRYLTSQSGRRETLMGFAVSTHLFFANLFYEVYGQPIMWIILGLLAGILWDRGARHLDGSRTD